MSNMMEGQSSQASGGGGGNAPALVLLTTSNQYAADLSAYENACRLDPRLQAFDKGIHQRTHHVFSKISTGVQVQSISLDSLQELTGVLLDMNNEVLNVIMEDSRDIWEHKDLRPLVDEYLENSKKTLDFCTNLANCLQKAVKSQLIIQLAVNKFEEELRSQDTVDGKKFPKTLEELQNFKAAGEPFTEEFFDIFKAIQGQQMSMLENLLVKKTVLDKRLKTVETWRRVTNVLFVTALVSALIFSVVAAAVAAPPVVTAVAAALALPIGTAGKWCNSLWNCYKNELKGQQELVSSMRIGARIAISNLESIKALVSRIEAEIESLLQNADFGIKEEDAVTLVIEEIKKQLEVFEGTIESLKRHTDKCIHDVAMARKEILQKIMNYSSRAADNTLWNVDLL